MSYEEIIKNIKNKNYYPVYFLTGEQTYFIDSLVALFENDVIPDEEKDFNLRVLFGKDISGEELAIMSRQFSMMITSYQLIIVKEAQEMSKIEALESYIKKPLQCTILVLCYKYKKIDSRTSFGKLIKEKTVFFETPKIYDNELPQWIEKQCEKMNVKITPKAAIMMSQFIGLDLQKIVNELEKLLLVLPQDKTITENLVEKHIGISKEYNVFELQNAIGMRNVYKANQILYYFAENESATSIPALAAILYQFFSKLMKYHFLKNDTKNLATSLGINPYFLKDYSTAAMNYSTKQISNIFLILQEYDMKSKGVGSTTISQGELMKEMIFKILH